MRELVARQSDEQVRQLLIAQLALELLLRHPERFTPLQPQSAAMRSLLSLIEQRRELVNDKTG